MPQGFVVYGAKGSGSVPVEAALTLLRVPFTVVEGAAWSDKAAAEALARVNPMRQVPALQLPDGQLMTESAAILTWIADAHPEGRLAPALDSPPRPQFLRWMSFVSSAIYALFWVYDAPSRLAADKAAEAVLAERTADRLEACWAMMESQTNAGPYILGDDLTVLDLYVAVVSGWAPGRARFHAAAQRLGQAVRHVAADPRLTALWAERFPRVGV